jgi:2-polyprenyl-3-methyl-5-hydroxy-6-metoxy-1,4-benzoquinol methylase
VDDAASERSRLRSIASDSLYAAGASGTSVRYSFHVLARHLRPGSILELGPAEGVMTEFLVKLRRPMTLVEGAESFCASLAERFPQCRVKHSLFEEYQPGERFDNIILGHVLEHVADPVDVLTHVRGWLAPGGMVFGAVPNARSLHRQAAVIMGLLREEHELNALDLHHGHRRVFDPESFRSAFTQAGLRVEVFGGYWLKPLSNAQIEETWTPEMLDAFMQLGERYPDIAAEIYVVAS